MQALADDPRTASRPATRYFQALVADALIDLDRVRALRREAFGRGCRAVGLLSDMARDGEDVLAELEEVDPIEARLVAAIHSEGTEKLSRLLEETQTSWGQRGEAMRELWWRSPPAAEAARGSFAEEAPAPPLGMADERERGRPAFPWVHGLRWAVKVRLPHRGESAEVLELLGRAEGDHAALARIRDLAQAQVSAHPSDLRWVALQYLDPQESDSLELFARLRPANGRDIPFLVGGVYYNRPEIVREALTRIASLCEGDAVAPVLKRTGSLLHLRESQVDLVQFLVGLRPRCTDERDLRALFDAAFTVGAAALRRELAGRLAASNDSRARFFALGALDSERPGSAAEAIERLRWTGWDESHLRWVALDIIEVALPEKRDDIVLEALRHIWERAPEEVPGARGDDCSPEFGLSGLVERDDFREAVMRAAADPAAPPYVHYFAVMATWRSRCSLEGLDTSIQALHDAGVSSRAIWLNRLRALDDEARLEACRRVFDALPRGPRAWQEREFVREVCQHLPRSEDVCVNGRSIAHLLVLADKLPRAPADEVVKAECGLGHVDTSVREAASEAIRARGEQTLPLLAALRGSSDPEVRVRAEELLGELAVPR